MVAKHLRPKALACFLSNAMQCSSAKQYRWSAAINPAMKVPFSRSAIDVMRSGRILGDDESSDELIELVLHQIFHIETDFGVAPTAIVRRQNQFAEYMMRKLVMLGTPLLTNAGRKDRRALGSCAAIPVDLQQSFSDVVSALESYYAQNMGSGFDLNPVPDPVSVVDAINRHAEELTAAGTCDRYIGNLANIDIDHPRVREFVSKKASGAKLPHLNLSVNIGEEFMAALAGDQLFTLRDGTTAPASLLWGEIVQAAWQCGDPGVLFLDRYNDDNPTPSVGRYSTTAPCAEVGLAPGESCVFGYLNLGGFLNGQHKPGIDFELLSEVTRLLVRVLDDALERSLDCYPTPASQAVMRAKRRIGIGIVGFADLLIRLGVPYDAPTATRILQDILIMVTFASKMASMELAQERGSFLAFAQSRYALTSDFLSRKYGGVSTDAVSVQDWQALEQRIRATGSLRNASTTALPPSGRTSLLLDASSSLEPWFSLFDLAGKLKPDLVDLVERHCGTGNQAHRLLTTIASRGTCQLPDVPTTIQALVKCATELHPMDHLRVVAAAARCVDDSASKTVNLPSDASPYVVSDVFLTSWWSGLKAISVYRDGAISGQPEILGGAPASS